MATVEATTWLDRRLRALATVGPPFFLGVFPLLLLVWVVPIIGHSAGVDFRNELWPGGRAVLDGLSPYPPLDEVATGARFIFPAPTALLMAPFALVPLPVAQALFSVVALCAALLSLRVLGVRDWRPYGALLLWSPVLSAVQSANLTLLLVLAVSLAWRYRDRPWVAGGALGVGIALKIILWPLLVWLIATRRYRAFSVSVSVAAAVTTVSFLIVGGFRYYLDVVRELEAAFAPHSYTPYALALKLGAAPGAAHALGYVVLAIALLAVWRYKSFTIAIVGVLLASPIVWLPYFTLLLVPLAILRPRFTPLWLAPLLFWPAPGTGNGDTWQTVWMMAAFCALAVILMRAALARPGPAPAQA